MDVSKIIELSRKQTGTSAGQISDESYLEYLNIIYNDIFSRLSVNSKKYTWQTYTTDIKANQSEYVIPTPTDSSTGLKLVLNAFVNGEKINLYDSNISDVLDVRSKEKYGIIRDGSIFIYPMPKEDKEGGLVLQGKYIPLDLTLENTSDEIKLAPEYHNILVKGLNHLVFGEKQVYDKQQLWEGYYLQAVKQMQIEGSMENESGYTQEMPDLSFLE